MNNSNIKKEKRVRRHLKIRTKVSGDLNKPRLSVFKSNMYISAQIIDDVNSKTLVSSHSRNFEKGTMMEKSKLVGSDIAKKAKGAKISKVVFDRGGFKYTGCVKALADSAREGGLEF